MTDCKLETLPPEIRTRILYDCGIDDLKSLVNASPTMFQQYLVHRSRIPLHNLYSDLGNSILEAFFVFRTNTFSYRKTRSRASIIDICQEYRNGYRSRFWNFTIPNLGKSKIIEIKKWHRSIVKPMIHQFVQFTLQRRCEGSNEDIQTTTLSTMEEIRLTRAVYRFQLLCNLFGALGFRDTDAQSIDDLSQHFLSIFEPWEIEEISSFYSFLFAKNKDLYLKIRYNLQGTDAIDLEQVNQNIDHITRRVDCATSCGLQLCKLFMKCADNFDSQCAFMYNCNRGSSHGCFLALHRSTEASALWTLPTVEAAYQYENTSLTKPLLLFRGDIELYNEQTVPSKAWTLYWNVTKAKGSTVVDVVDSYSLIHLGYIFWDENRLNTLLKTTKIPSSC